MFKTLKKYYLLKFKNKKNLKVINFWALMKLRKTANAEPRNLCPATVQIMVY